MLPDRFDATDAPAPHMWLILRCEVCQLGRLLKETNGYTLLSNCCLTVATRLRKFSEEQRITSVKQYNTRL
jgi:hypothetical protein